jgi:hypothetical protein
LLRQLLRQRLLNTLLLLVAAAAVVSWVVAVVLAGTGLQPDFRFQLGQQLQLPSALVVLVL